MPLLLTVSCFSKIQTGFNFLTTWLTRVVPDKGLLNVCVRACVPSTTIHSIRIVQFTRLTVLFHNLSPGPLWFPVGMGPSTSYSIHYKKYTHTHTHTRLTALFRDYPGEPVPER